MMSAEMFRPLSPEDEEQFRAWARDNFEPFTEISSVWHPVVREECAKMDVEAMKEKHNAT